MSFFLFGVIPMLIALTSRFWFNAFPSVRRIRDGAKNIDAEKITLPCRKPLLIKDLRSHEKCGDRVVVAHHLYKYASGIQRKTTRALVRSTVYSMLLLVIVEVVSHQPDLATTRMNDGAAMSLPDLSASKFWGFLVSEWPPSLVFLLFLVELVTYLTIISEQAEKFEDVINAATDQTELHGPVPRVPSL
jgi:hypothetical protein